MTFVLDKVKQFGALTGVIREMSFFSFSTPLTKYDRTISHHYHVRHKHLKFSSLEALSPSQFKSPYRPMTISTYVNLVRTIPTVVLFGIYITIFAKLSLCFSQGSLIVDSFESTYCQSGVDALTRGPIHYDLQRCGGQCRSIQAPRNLYRMTVNATSYSVDNVEVEIHANLARGGNILGFAVVAITEEGGTAGRWVVDEDDPDPEVLRATCDSLLEGQVIFQAQPSNNRSRVRVIWNPRRTNYGSVIFRAWVVQRMNSIFVVDSERLTNPLNGQEHMHIESHFKNLLESMTNNITIPSSTAAPPVSQRQPNPGLRLRNVNQSLQNSARIRPLPNFRTDRRRLVNTRQRAISGAIQPSGSESTGPVRSHTAKPTIEEFEDAFLTRLVSGFELGGRDPFLDLNRELPTLFDLIPDNKSVLALLENMPVGGLNRLNSSQGWEPRVSLEGRLNVSEEESTTHDIDQSGQPHDTQGQGTNNVSEGQRRGGATHSSSNAPPTERPGEIPDTQDNNMHEVEVTSGSRPPPTTVQGLPTSQSNVVTQHPQSQGESSGWHSGRTNQFNNGAQLSDNTAAGLNPGFQQPSKNINLGFQPGVGFMGGSQWLNNPWTNSFRPFLGNNIQTHPFTNNWIQGNNWMNTHSGTRTSASVPFRGSQVQLNNWGSWGTRTGQNSQPQNFVRPTGPNHNLPRHIPPSITPGSSNTGFRSSPGSALSPTRANPSQGGWGIVPRPLGPALNSNTRRFPFMSAPNNNMRFVNFPQGANNFAHNQFGVNANLGATTVGSQRGNANNIRVRQGIPRSEADTSGPTNAADSQGGLGSFDDLFQAVGGWGSS